MRIIPHGRRGQPPSPPPSPGVSPSAPASPGDPSPHAMPVCVCGRGARCVSPRRGEVRWFILLSPPPVPRPETWTLSLLSTVCSWEAENRPVSPVRCHHLGRTRRGRVFPVPGTRWWARPCAIGRPRPAVSPRAETNFSARRSSEGCVWSSSCKTTYLRFFRRV